MGCGSSCPASTPSTLAALDATCAPEEVRPVHKEAAEGTSEDECVIVAGPSASKLLQRGLSQHVVPSYWRNRTADLGAGFDDKYAVPDARRALFERLLHGTTDDTATKQLRITDASRIEDAGMWGRYHDAKVEMRKRLGQCKSPADIDEFGGHAKTTVWIQNAVNQGDLEAKTLLPNLESKLNEIFVWHGTSKAAWESIADDGFVLRKKKKGRYGPGLYFAEDSAKALEYAKNGEGGEQALLLCRVTLGELYFTSYHSDHRVPQKALDKGKDATLAHPHAEGDWAREFIVYDVAHVYPEYAFLVNAA